MASLFLNFRFRKKIEPLFFLGRFLNFLKRRRKPKINRPGGLFLEFPNPPIIILNLSHWWLITVVDFEVTLQGHCV